PIAPLYGENLLRLSSSNALTSDKKAVDNPASCMTTYDNDKNKKQGHDMTTLASPSAQQPLACSASIAATRHRTGFAGG
ncbi:hypothetical protein, partial [Klebsiella pneumoniae]|uniref:hypothetical protein n=1 Tax=Klebsiella pneumoniae TaxID=573 RepID=UPI001CF5BE1F